MIGEIELIIVIMIIIIIIIIIIIMIIIFFFLVITGQLKLLHEINFYIAESKIKK